MMRSWFLGKSGVLGSRNVPQVYTYHALVTMSGTLLFSSNNGGGLSINQGLLKIAGQVSFRNNVALHGGGLQLTDRAMVSTKVVKPPVCGLCEAVYRRRR